jgi:hypothetical protein
MADLVSQFFEHKPIEHLLGQASRQKISTTIAGGKDPGQHRPGPHEKHSDQSRLIPHMRTRTVIFQYNWKMRLVVGIPLHESPFSLQLLMMFLRRRPISLIYFLPDLQIHLQFSNEGDCLAR